MTRLPVSRRRFSLIVALIAPWLAGCPVPIPETVAPSAPVRGSVVRSDGRPLAGVDVVVSNAYRPCSRPLARTRTDTAGVFQLPATFEHHRVVWTVGGDRMFMPYDLCMPVQDTLRPVYQGQGAVRGQPLPESVRCVQWEWQDRTRITCSGGPDLLPQSSSRGFVEGGRWSEGSASGMYRVFVAEERTRVGGKRRDRGHVYVQWLEQDGVEAPYRVRATVQVGVDYRKVGSLAEPAICERDGTWYVGLRGDLWRDWWRGYADTRFTVALGPPGQVSDVEVGPACDTVGQPPG